MEVLIYIVVNDATRAESGVIRECRRRSRGLCSVAASIGFQELLGSPSDGISCIGGFLDRDRSRDRLSRFLFGHASFVDYIFQ